ncbi:proline-rich protein 36-like isoform X4 [Rousettus aegyptiacus]|uniref:proline-rich protein 36-like isoform X4 n=1 Tax=Rousettus aegyptiacus TaxID=9407 RepID=UPI00168D2F7A|nr:proline-rich protein 36-like isoform X4 [Rousettus aegyptiacus]
MPSPEASLSHQPATGQTRKLSPFLRRITPGGCAEAVPPLPAPRRPQWMPVDIYVPGAELARALSDGRPRPPSADSQSRSCFTAPDALDDPACRTSRPLLESIGYDVLLGKGGGCLWEPQVTVLTRPAPVKKGWDS